MASHHHRVADGQIYEEPKLVRVLVALARIRRGEEVRKARTNLRLIVDDLRRRRVHRGVRADDRERLGLRLVVVVVVAFASRAKQRASSLRLGLVDCAVDFTRTTKTNCIPKKASL